MTPADCADGHGAGLRARPAGGHHPHHRSAGEEENRLERRRDLRRGCSGWRSSWMNVYIQGVPRHADDRAGRRDLLRRAQYAGVFMDTTSRPSSSSPSTPARAGGRNHRGGIVSVDSGAVRGARHRHDPLADHDDGGPAAGHPQHPPPWATSRIVNIKDSACSTSSPGLRAVLPGEERGGHVLPLLRRFGFIIAVIHLTPDAERQRHPARGGRRWTADNYVIHGSQSGQPRGYQGIRRKRKRRPLRDGTCD